MNDHKTVHTPPKIQQEPNISWVIYGIIYILIVAITSHPTVIEYFPQGSFRSILCIWPMVGIAYMLRDAVQYSYENTPEKKDKSSGFWPSMIFVGIALALTYQYRHPSTLLAGTSAYIIASFMDGWVFSKTNKHGLCYRLLISNIVAAIFDSGVFLSVMIYQGHMKFDLFGNLLTTFMEVSPALIAFILGTTIFAKALGVVDFGIGRRINRG